MKLLSHEPAALGAVRAAHEEAIEQAHEHLNGSPAKLGRPPGVRNGEGAGPRVILRKLSLKHKQVIALVMQGLSREDAGEAVGFTPEYITFLLQQPLAKEHIAAVNRAVNTQLEALHGKSVQAMADGLNHADPDVKLRAAKLQLQATGRLEPSEEGRKTAEDVVQAILLGVQVNVQQR